MKKLLAKHYITNKIEYFFMAYLSIYFLLSILFINNYPLVNMDEFRYLSIVENIGRNGVLLDKLGGDLLKSSYSGILTIIQGFALNLFSFDIFYLRLFSLSFAVIFLYVFNMVGKLVFGDSIKSFFVTILISLDIGFIYYSHYSSYDIVLTLILILEIYVIALSMEREGHDTNNLKYILMNGIILGLSYIFIPNSLIIICSIILVYLYLFINSKEINIIKLSMFIISLSILPGVAKLLLVSVNKPWLNIYFSGMGQIFSIINISKLSEVCGNYLSYILYEKSKYFYIPNLRYHFFIYLIVIISYLVRRVTQKNKVQKDVKLHILIISLLGIIVGQVVTQASENTLIIMLPLMYLSGYCMIQKIELLKINYVYGLIIILSIILSFSTITEYINSDLSCYRTCLNRIITKGDRVLANSDVIVLTNSHCVYSYSNLESLDERNVTINDYLKEKQIEYIIYPEEMDYINGEKIYNKYYGDVQEYYIELTNFIDSNCSMMHSFEDHYYGRIIPYNYDEDFQTKIYRILYY